jgi:hypothetical protein
MESIEELLQQGFEPLNLPDYKDYFLISPQGIIFNKQTNRFAVYCKSNGGQLQVSLYVRKKGAKNFKVSRLVAMQFVPNPHNHYWALPKNGMVEDIRAANLEWVSVSDRLKSLRAKTDQPKIICLTTGKYYPSLAEAARDNKCSTGSVAKVCKGKLNSTNNLKFSYFSSSDTDKSDLLDIMLE